MYVGKCGADVMMVSCGNDDDTPAYVGATTEVISEYYGSATDVHPLSLRDNQPPLLAVWGENDPSFVPAGAKAFKRDLPNAEIHFVPSGHFALESHHTEIAALMREFLERILK